MRIGSDAYLVTARHYLANQRHLLLELVKFGVSEGIRHFSDDLVTRIAVEAQHNEVQGRVFELRRVNAVEREVLVELRG